MTPELALAAASLAGAFLVSALAARWLRTDLLARWGPLDRPNARSLHDRPVPRTGGLAVLPGILTPPLAFAGLGGDPAPAAWLWLGLALLPVALVSWRDDRGHVSWGWRLLAHLLAGLALLGGGFVWTALPLPGGGLPLPFWIGAPLTILSVIWTINLFNFMDGMDGLAGSMALCGFGALAVLGALGGEPAFALSAAGIAAAAAGFLTGNLPPARIFLGDTGAASLGLLAAGFGLWGAQLGLFELWAAWLAFSPFIVDATWTLLARLARRERIWEAHRAHHYQRLVLAGWSHGRTLARAVPLMLAAAASAAAAPGLAPSEQWLLLGAWAAIYLLIHVRVGAIARGGR